MRDPVAAGETQFQSADTGARQMRIAHPPTVSKFRRGSAPAPHNSVHPVNPVQNLCYLLCEGGTGWDGYKDLETDGIPYADFEGIGVEMAAKIAYQTLTAYCGPRTDYCEVRAHWLDAAIDVVEADKADGEPWTEEDIAITNAVVKAWAAVMPFERLQVRLENAEEGEKVVVVGLAGWDGETVKEVENGDVRSSANPSSPTISDLVRLRRFGTPQFGDGAEDIDITKVKTPFVEEGEDDPTPNKYDIVVKLPEDASSGFYRLEW